MVEIMNEPFEYIYWRSARRIEPGWELRKIAETVIGGMVMAATLVLVMMSWLCM